jgi:hypothetical protein
MARNPVFQLMVVALVVGLMFACAGGSRAATPTNDARDAWTWESSAGGGWTKAGAFGGRMPFTLEARYGRRVSRRVSLGTSVGCTFLGGEGYCATTVVIPEEGSWGHPDLLVIPVVGLVKFHLPTGANAEPYFACGGGMCWLHGRSATRFPYGHRNDFYPELCALAGLTGRSRFSPRLEIRYECYRGTESEWDWLHPWVQQVTVSLGAQFRAGIHD